jgi:hypothetical protein
MYMKRYEPITALAALLILTACSSDPVRWTLAPTPSGASANVQAEVGTTFRLAPGQFASVAGGEIFVAFRELEADSRCPGDVVCVWEGDAAVVIGTASEGMAWTWTTLHTTLEPKQLSADEFIVELLQVEPTRRTSASIDPEDYRVVLSVEDG